MSELTKFERWITEVAGSEKAAAIEQECKERSLRHRVFKFAEETVPEFIFEAMHFEVERGDFSKLPTEVYYPIGIYGNYSIWVVFKVDGDVNICGPIYRVDGDALEYTSETVVGKILEVWRLVELHTVKIVTCGCCRSSVRVLKDGKPNFYGTLTYSALCQRCGKAANDYRLDRCVDEIEAD